MDDDELRRKITVLFNKCGEVALHPVQVHVEVDGIGADHVLVQSELIQVGLLRAHEVSPVAGMVPQPARTAVLLVDEGVPLDADHVPQEAAQVHAERLRPRERADLGVGPTARGHAGQLDHAVHGQQAVCDAVARRVATQPAALAPHVDCEVAAGALVAARGDGPRIRGVVDGGELHPVARAGLGVPGPQQVVRLRLPPRPGRGRGAHEAGGARHAVEHDEGAHEGAEGRLLESHAQKKRVNME
mmetsp:Transcript_103571/g.278389  ORF Transcript_103571/g.278389 Transcript_103571/m.278389 type:complete len:244 (-) Transcript_103571:69-800(-)